MGLFSKLKKAFKKVVKPIARTVFGALPGPAGAIGATVFGGAIQPRTPAPGRLPPIAFGGGQLPTFPGAGALPPGLAAPTVGPGTARLRRIAAGGVEVGPQGLCPVGFHPAKDGSGRCVRNRRMNVLNHKAAMRAIRRIKGARKMLMKIERQLPKPRSRPRQVVHRRRLIHEDG